VGLALPRVLVWRQSFLRLLRAHLGRIPLGRKEDNGRVECSHRTDDEAFYLPCVCCRWRVWRRFWVRVWVGCIITPMSVCILGMGWRFGRRMGVVWRWVFRVRDM
jgi:hypothetical protein